MQPVIVKYHKFSTPEDVKAVEVEPVYRAGNYAVTRLLKSIDGEISHIDGQYTITYIPTGHGGDTYFTDKRNAIGFCKWLANEFPEANQDDYVLRQGEITDMVERAGGAFVTSPEIGGYFHAIKRLTYRISDI